jgi:hypothetical protein
MLNPSVADAEVDDPTVRRCLGFCKRWACGRLYIVNLFAFRSSSPAQMMMADDPVGRENERHLARAVRGQHRFQEPVLSTGPVVCAWGAHGGYMGRDTQVLGWLAQFPTINLVCLGLTKDGHPRHPLYVPYSAPLVPYGRRSAA